MRSWVLFLLAGSVGCGAGSQESAATPAPAGPETGAVSEAAEPALVAPEGPSPLTAAERQELGGKCNPIEEQLYYALKDAKEAVTQILAAERGAADANERALKAGLARLAKPEAAISPADFSRCVELFTKSATREIWEYEPDEVAARATLDACARSASAAFGKRSTAFTMGAAPAGMDPNVPRFCSDASPVPASLADLPYTSKPADWATDEWKCLGFGLRAQQSFQLEYRTDPSATEEYECIARFLPRKGGPAVELTRWGKVNREEGILEDSKQLKRRLVPRP